MRTVACAAGDCLAALAVVGWTAALPLGPAAKIDEGRYLVEQWPCAAIAMPRTMKKGNPFVKSFCRALPLPFNPSIPMPVWADKSPSIAGLPGWEDKDAIKFLMTGLAYNELPGRPPMPQYRFKQEAIVAYLRSLKPSEGAAPPRK